MFGILITYCGRNFRYTDRDAWIFEHDVNLLNISRWPSIPDECNLVFGRGLGHMYAYWLNSEAAGLLCEKVENERLLGQIDTYMYELVAMGRIHGLAVHQFNMDIIQNKHHGTTIKH